MVFLGVRTLLAAVTFHFGVASQPVQHLARDPDGDRLRTYTVDPNMDVQRLCCGEPQQERLQHMWHAHDVGGCRPRRSRSATPPLRLLLLGRLSLWARSIIR